MPTPTRLTIALACAALTASAIVPAEARKPAKTTHKPMAPMAMHDDAAAAPVTLTVLIYEAGPNWKAGEPPQNQDLGGHFGYMKDLFDRGVLVANGPTLDDGRGFYLLHPDAATGIDAIVAADPGVTSGVLRKVSDTPWTILFEQIGREVGGNKLFLLDYAPGPRWQAGKPLTGQNIGAHVKYVQGKFGEGVVLAGGPAGQGGRYLIDAADETAARAFVAADPGVTGGVFAPKIRPWQTFNRQGLSTAMAKMKG